MLPISYPTGQQTNILELIHDAFQPLSYWNNFMPRSQYTGVAIDTHIYQIFTDQVCSLSMFLEAFNRDPLMKISHHHRKYRLAKRVISSLHAETRGLCQISIKISCTRS